MSYEIVKSIDLRDLNNIQITSATNNVSPRVYKKAGFDGDLEDLYRLLLSKGFQFLIGNRQKVHEAFLTAYLYLKEKNVDTYKLYSNDYSEDTDGYKEYKESFDLFKRVLERPKNDSKYYIAIDGYYLVKLDKDGFSYSIKPQTQHDLITGLLAKSRHENVVIRKATRTQGMAYPDKLKVLFDFEDIDFTKEDMDNLQKSLINTPIRSLLEDLDNLFLDYPKIDFSDEVTDNEESLVIEKLKATIAEDFVDKMRIENKKAEKSAFDSIEYSLQPDYTDSFDYIVIVDGEILDWENAIDYYVEYGAENTYKILAYKLAES